MSCARRCLLCRDIEGPKGWFGRGAYAALAAPPPFQRRVICERCERTVLRMIEERLEMEGIEA